MPTQNIDFSTVGSATFNGTELSAINLNGAEIWSGASTPIVKYATTTTNGYNTTVNSSPYAELQNGEYVGFVASHSGSYAPITGRRGDLILFKENDEVFLGYTVSGDSNFIYMDAAGTDHAGLVGLNSAPHKVLAGNPVNLPIYGNLPIWSCSLLVIVVGRVDGDLNVVDRLPSGNYSGVTAYNMAYAWHPFNTVTTVSWSGDNLTLSYVNSIISFNATIPPWTSNPINVSNFITGWSETPMYVDATATTSSRTVGDKIVFRIDRTVRGGAPTGAYGDILYIQKA